MSALYTPPTAAQVAEQSMRDAIDELIAECTDAQVAGLHRIHNNAPWKGLGNCPVNQLFTTYELLRRTVMQNAKATGSAS